MKIKNGSLIRVDATLNPYVDNLHGKIGIVLKKHDAYFNVYDHQSGTWDVLIDGVIHKLYADEFIVIALENVHSCPP